MNYMKYLSKGNHHVALSKTTKYPTTLILRAVDSKIKPHSGPQRPQPDPKKKKRFSATFRDENQDKEQVPQTRKFIHNNYTRSDDQPEDTNTTGW